MKTKRLVPIAVAIGFFLLAVAPLTFFLYSPVSKLKISPDLSVLDSPGTLHTISNTLLLSAIELVIGFALFFPYAWLVNRTDVPGADLFDAIVIFGKTVPNFFKAIGWAVLLAPNSGVINVLLQSLTNNPNLNINIFTPLGLALTLAFGALPVRYIIMGPAFKNLNASQEDASRIAGGSTLETFVRVTLPALKQITLITLVLVFLGVMTDFDYPLVIAPAAHFSVLSVALYYSVETSPPSFGAAEALGLVLLLISIIAFALYLYLTRKSFAFETMRGIQVVRTVKHLGRWRWPAFLYCVVAFFFSFLFPVIGILWLALTHAGNIFWFVGLSNFALALKYPFLSDALTNSIMLGIATVAISVPLSVLIAYGVFKGRFRGSRLLESAVMIPRAFPAIVYGLALFLTFLYVPGLNFFYGTIWPFVISNVVMLSPSLILTASGNMVQISEELEESSVVSGASWIRTFGKVIVPLNRHAIFNNGVSAFLDSIRELGAVVLLATPAFYLFMTLALDAFTSASGGLNLICAVIILIVIFLSAVTAGAKLIERRVWGGSNL